MQAFASSVKSKSSAINMLDSLADRAANVLDLILSSLGLQDLQVSLGLACTSSMGVLLPLCSCVPGTAALLQAPAAGDYHCV